MIGFTPLYNFKDTAELLSSVNSRLSKTAAKKLIKKFKISRQSWKKDRVIYLPLDIVNFGLICPHYDGNENRIIFEDKDIIAIDKNVNVYTQPHDYTCSQNALSYLCSVGKLEAIQINKDHYDRGLIHRLDFETSGVLILAKTDKKFEELREHFDKNVYYKNYLAIVSGDMRSHIGELESFVKGALKKGSKIVAGNSYDHLVSLKILNVDYSNVSQMSLVEIELKTGFRHQIRFQLSELGFPIVGDELYGGQKAERILLHSSAYTIEHNGEKVTIKSGTPVKFTI